MCAPSCSALYDPKNPPGSSVHGVLQARILEWVAISSSRACFQPRKRTWISGIGVFFFFFFFFYQWATWEAHSQYTLIKETSGTFNALVGYINQNTYSLKYILFFLLTIGDGIVKLFQDKITVPFKPLITNRLFKALPAAISVLVWKHYISRLPFLLWLSFATHMKLYILVLLKTIILFISKFVGQQFRQILAGYFFCFRWHGLKSLCYSSHNGMSFGRKTI